MHLITFVKLSPKIIYAKCIFGISPSIIWHKNHFYKGKQINTYEAKRCFCFIAAPPIGQMTPNRLHILACPESKFGINKSKHCWYMPSLSVWRLRHQFCLVTVLNKRFKQFWKSKIHVVNFVTVGLKIQANTVACTHFLRPFNKIQYDSRIK